MIWTALFVGAPSLAAWQVFERISTYRSDAPVGLSAAAAFAASIVALGLLGYALSSHWRFLEKLGTLIMAIFGSALARGRLELWAAQEHVWREWRRYQGERDAEPTADAVYEFVRDVYGVDLNGAVRRTSLMNTRQLRRLVDGITSLLLRYRRWSYTKATKAGMPDGLAEGIEAARKATEEAQAAQATWTPPPQPQAAPARPAEERVEYGTIEFDLPTSTQMLMEVQPKKKKADNNAWVQAPSSRDEQVVEFDLPAATDLGVHREAEMPSIEEILARAIQPQGVVKKAAPPQARVESGAALRRITEREVHYVHHCQPCGYVEGTIRKARRPGPRTKFASSFKCPRCRNVQKVVIAGEF